MRLWKKISIYFIYPACMLAAGLAAGLGVQEFFYPNRFPPAEERTKEPENQAEPEAEEQARAEGGQVPAAVGQKQTITADTRYVVERGHEDALPAQCACESVQRLFVHVRVGVVCWVVCWLNGYARLS